MGFLVKEDSLFLKGGQTHDNSKDEQTKILVMVDDYTVLNFLMLGILNECLKENVRLC